MNIPHIMQLDSAAAREAVRRRHSVRTFTGEPLSPQVMEALTQALGREPLPARAPGFGTYGMIRGAACFLPVMAQTSGNSGDAACRAADIAEQIVLWLTLQGVGTCWLGATYHGIGRPQADCRVLALIAAGIPAPKPHLLDRISRGISRSDTRRPLADLFDVAPGSIYLPALEMVRLAPSAMNRQPWRAIEQGGTLHFYCDRADDYRDLDMGIAVAHFRTAAPEGDWLRTESPAAPRGTSYFASYRGR